MTQGNHIHGWRTERQKDDVQRMFCATCKAVKFMPTVHERDRNYENALHLCRVLGMEALGRGLVVVSLDGVEMPPKKPDATLVHTSVTPEPEAPLPDPEGPEVPIEAKKVEAPPLVEAISPEVPVEGPPVEPLVASAHSIIPEEAREAGISPSTNRGKAVYTPTQKHEAVDLAKRVGLPQAAKSLKIPQGTIATWFYRDGVNTDKIGRKGTVDAPVPEPLPEPEKRKGYMVDAVIELQDWGDIFLVRTVFNPLNSTVVEIPAGLFTRYKSVMTQLERVQLELLEISEAAK